MTAIVPYCVPDTKWNYHTPQGPEKADIGGNQPTGWKLQQLPDGSVYLEITGGAYSDVEFYATLPTIPEEFTGKLIHDFDITPTQSASTSAQALEFDTILTFKGNTYMNQGSTQLNVNEGGHIQITNSKGAWEDSGFNPGLFAPGEPTHVKIFYQYDLVKLTGGVNAISLNHGAPYKMPANLLNEPALPLKWSDSLFAQFQLDLNAVGGTFGFTISNGQYTWL